MKANTRAASSEGFGGRVAFMIAVLGSLLAISCAPPPRPAPLPSSAPVSPVAASKPPPVAPEVHWDPPTSDDTGVTLVAEVIGGADTLDAVPVSVSCPSAKVGRAEIMAERASLRLEVTEVANALQCHGLRLTVSRGGLSTPTVVPFDLTLQLLPGVAGGVGVSRTTKSPALVVSVPGSSPNSRFTFPGESIVTRGVTGGNAEFVVPILSLTRAALRRQHAIATTGFAPIEYVIGLTVAGQSLPAELPEPAPTPP